MILTTLDVMFVVMEIVVLPLPRCTALITIVSTLKNMPPMMIRKYTTAASCVSALLPARRIIKGAPATNRTVTIRHRTSVIRSAVSSTSFALLRFFSPFLLATSADTATLTPKNGVRPINFGCVVSPTAATA